MTTEVFVVFDDTVPKKEVITDVIGTKGFSQVVVKKRRLSEYYEDSLRNIFTDMKWRIVNSRYDFKDIADDSAMELDDVRVLHCYSDFIISDESKARYTFGKLPYIDAPLRLMSGNKTAAVMFDSYRSYQAFLRKIDGQNSSSKQAKNIDAVLNIEGLVDIGNIGNFIQCITGNFDSRYFNSLQGDDYTIVKKSSNKKKIRAEYEFYHLLPDDMKYWYVMPFDYKEAEEFASYTMQRYHMTDLAIKWVHGSIDSDEFSELMVMYFRFFDNRHRKAVDKDTYAHIAEKLYVDKVKERIATLKNLPEFKKIETVLSASTKPRDVDSLVGRYFSLKEKIEGVNLYPCDSVIGHGDPCFANALYNKSTHMLKFIDPKGALNEDELWTNPYYDIAKLSHSVCGRYDFFNNGLYDITVDTNFNVSLNIDFDNSMYKELFKKHVEANGYDYRTVRLYEASLFISMLPLHIDYPHKVLGFILNAWGILEELENDV